MTPTALGWAGVVSLTNPVLPQRSPLLAANGRIDEARGLFERLIALSNDLGLRAEEYDVKRQRQVGDFPQALATSR
jgi:GH15 family glucan-1,4-alpha-glucosidase